MHFLLETILMSVSRHKNLSIRIQSSYMCFCLFVFVFFLITKLLNSFAVAFLAVKVYLHASYMQLFDYLRICDIYIILI